LTKASSRTRPGRSAFDLVAAKLLRPLVRPGTVCRSSCRSSQVLLSYAAKALDAVEPVGGRVVDALASADRSVLGSVVPRPVFPGRTEPPLGSRGCAPRARSPISARVTCR